MVAKVQHYAPAFNKVAVVDGTFEEISLEQYRGKYVVLAFVPMAFTLVCPTEVLAFSEAISKFKALDCAVLFASTDSEYALYAWTKTSREDGGVGPVNIPLISDRNFSMSRDYGVLIEGEGVALRGLFIIDRDGIIRHITINDLPVGRNVDEALRVIEAFQYFDKYGAGLPCNWKAGTEAIEMDEKQTEAGFRVDI